MKKLCISIVLLCAVCAFAFACHQHTFSQEWSYNNDYHWHKATCEHDLVSGQAMHSLKDGQCSVCGYSNHVHTYKTTYSYDDTYHWYASTCGHDIVKDKGYHDFENDVCKDCGYEYHEHTFENEWSYDDDYHWYASTCGHDFATKDKSAHSVENGVCLVCGKQGLSVVFEMRNDGKYKLKRYVGNDKEYEIPTTYDSKQVVEISPYAFAGCIGIEKIVVPTSISYIGEGAFWGCSSLKEITLPFVGATAFETKWAQTTLFGYVFGSDYYAGGISTKQFTITKEIEYFLPTTLTKVTVTAGKVYSGAFRNCVMLTTINLPQNATTIEDETFVGCASLTSITIPQNVTYVGRESFQNCISLTSITIPSKVKRIRDKAFQNCELLSSATIPASVEEMGRLIYDGCLSLKKITVDENNSKFVGVDGVVYNKEKTKIVAMPTAYTGALNLPATLQELDVTIFENSYGISSISIDESNTVYASEGGLLYNEGKTEIVLVPKAIEGKVVIAQGIQNIPNGAFYGASKMTGVEFPSTLKTIGAQAFAKCKKLNGVVFPNSIKGISMGAFFECSSLDSIVIPSSVTHVGDYTFESCIALNIFVEVAETVQGWDDYWSMGIGGGVYYLGQWEYVDEIPTPKA